VGNTVLERERERERERELCITQTSSNTFPVFTIYDLECHLSKKSFHITVILPAETRPKSNTPFYETQGNK
jgi:hypothetical protein